MTQKATNFTAEDVKALEQCRTLDEAKAKLIAMVQRSSKQSSITPIAPRKIAYLLNVSIRNAKSVKDVLSIAWNMLLSGENLSVNSNYQKSHKGW